MADKGRPSGNGGFGKFRWIFYAMLAALVIGSLMMSQSGRIPDWEKCQESLFQQMFSDQCTPRRGFAPDSDGAPAAADSGQNV